MDGHRFDTLVKRLGARHSRRSLMKGLVGLGGAAAVTTLGREGAGAQWSVAVCLPDGAAGYTQRLVPKAAVPLYVSRYGAVLPENGSCLVCQPGFKSCGSGCIPASDCCEPCGPNGTCDDGRCICPPFLTWHEGACIDPCTLTTCTCGSLCAATPAGDTVCLANYNFACGLTCNSDEDCNTAGDPTCLRPQGECSTGVGACGSYVIC